MFPEMGVLFSSFLGKEYPFVEYSGKGCPGGLEWEPGNTLGVLFFMFKEKTCLGQTAPEQGTLF